LIERGYSVRFKFLFLLMLLFFLFAFSLPAYALPQASCFSQLVGTFDSRSPTNNATWYLNNMANVYGSTDYYTLHFCNNSAGSVLNRLTGDAVFYYAGHSTSGGLCCYSPNFNPNDTWLNAKDNEGTYPGYGTEVWYLCKVRPQINDVLLAVYHGCDTARTDSRYGNLLIETHYYGGAKSALGFSSTLIHLDGLFNYWGTKFWYYATQWNSTSGYRKVYQAANDATYATGQAYTDSYVYGGHNNWSITPLDPSHGGADGGNFYLYPARYDS